MKIARTGGVGSAVIPAAVNGSTGPAAAIRRWASSGLILTASKVLAKRTRTTAGISASTASGPNRRRDTRMTRWNQPPKSSGTNGSRMLATALITHGR